MNPTPNSIRLNRNTVAAIVGPEAASRLSEIDHRALAHGSDWEWQHGAQVFTAAGLEKVRAELAALGLHGAAARLAESIKNCVVAAAFFEPAPAGELRPVVHVDPDESAMAAASRSRRHASDVEASPYTAE